MSLLLFKDILISLKGEDMNAGSKYYIELNLECVFESNEDDKEAIIAKINEAISKMVKDENIIHLNINTNLISEGNLLTSLASSMGGEFN